MAPAGSTKRIEVLMEQDKNTRIIEIDGQKFKVTSVFNKNSDTDIINLIYDKFKSKERKGKLGFVENPFCEENKE